MSRSWLWSAGLAVLGAMSMFFWQPAHSRENPARSAPAKLEIGPRPVPTANYVDPETAATLVVYNTSDRDSDDLARFYAEKRGIPKERVVGLKCAITEEITRDDYDRTIAEPLRELFKKNGWWDLRTIDHPFGRVEKNRIRFIALMRGMPLKIAPYSGYEGDRVIGPPEFSTHSEAAVDSELATLGAFNRVISGPRQNEYFRSYARILDLNLNDMMLVCRLDGPTPEIVKRMISDSITVEQQGLRGFTYIDARNIQQAGYKEGDSWMYGAANECRLRGLPVILDNGEGLFPEAYPMNDAALYYGWYTGTVAGPFVRPDFRFARGAVAAHIHSFSASTLRSPVANWCAPLLAAGAAATFGNVYEPYLTLTPLIDVFNDRLLKGFTFAESAWMATRATSWQTTMIGDPLYRPFKFTNDATLKPGVSDWDEYRAGAKLWFLKDRASGEAALRASAKRLRSGLIWEGLGLLELTVPDGGDAALAAFREARKAYTMPDDGARAAIHEVILLKKTHRGVEALSLVESLSRSYRKSRALEVLRML